ncbi:MAG: cyclopropane-fatty-acyl-phospholipid synthase family protein [Desulfobacterales bacterium]|jgi:cyclopropane-fatty-acyl-phospholipid synthase|nr:cyclopropane-fatty-acyl-phospholipid synthase family protein [Desulfobacterales bacterium]
MTAHIIPAEAPVLENLKVRSLDRFSRRILIRLLEKIERGRLVIVDGAERMVFGRSSAEFPLQAVITVHHQRFYGDCLFRGTIGAGEAYMARFWSADDLTAVVRLFALHPEVFSGMDTGMARIMAPVVKYVHALNKNTRAGSRRNIVAHYDLGNDFYRLFLDDTLTYSCGIFEQPESTLAEASAAKYERICRKLELTAADHVLEIGTGWGGFALHAAARYGCRVTTTTISERQHELAGRRIAAAGLAGRITLLKQDYRDLTGSFDKLVSIEMIEAVGHQFLEQFFRVCSRRLKPDGAMLLQAITIRDQVFDWHKKNVDFIKRYIFPGSCIPSVAAICGAVARATDLRLFHLEDITPHYATTLRHWRQNFFRNIEQVKALGFPDAFIRMWEFYLCYCEGGFAERYLGDVQMIFTQPMSRKEPLLPPLASAAGAGR